MAGANVEYMFDVTETLTAQNLYENHAHDLPLLVVVASGFYGNREEMCFSTGQVLRLHQLRQQGRALVHDDQKKSLSVPLDYSHLFYVGHDQSKALSIQDIVESYKLPVKVRFADSHMRFDCGPDHTVRSFNTLKIIRKHEETYFLANTVVQGQLLETVIPIPMYLKDVRFSLVTGVKGRGIEDGGWSHMQSLLYSQAQHLDFSQDHGDTEMVQLSEKPIKASDNIYQNIETNIYINVKEQPQRRRQQQPQQQLPPQQQRQTPHPGPQRQRRPPPPQPPASASQQYRGDAATASVPTSAAATATPEGPVEVEYMNLSTLQKHLMTKTAAASSQTGKQQTVGSSQPEENVYEVDPSHDDTSVYEPIAMDSLHRAESTKYTPLLSQQTPPPTLPHPAPPPTPVSSGFESELQKALKKRQKQRVTSAEDPPTSTPPVTGKSPPAKTIADDTQPQQPPPWKIYLKSTKPKSSTASPKSNTGPAEVSSEASSSQNLTMAPAANIKPQITTPKPPLKNKPAVLSPKPPGKISATELSGASNRPQHPAPKAGINEPRPKPQHQATKVDNANSSSGNAGQNLNRSQDGPAQVLPVVPVKGLSMQAKPEQQNPQTSSRQEAGGPPQKDDVPADVTYINQREMAVIVPSTRPGGSMRGGRSVSEEVAGKKDSVEKSRKQEVVSAVIQTLPTSTPPDDLAEGLKPQPTTLPLDQSLDNWTIQDVQQMLGRLNLSRYQGLFQDNLVDGNLLQQLTSAILTTEFGMTGVEVIRLQNFVTTGHLPK